MGSQSRKLKPSEQGQFPLPTLLRKPVKIAPCVTPQFLEPQRLSQSSGCRPTSMRQHQRKTRDYKIGTTHHSKTGDKQSTGATEAVKTGSRQTLQLPAVQLRRGGTLSAHSGTLTRGSVASIASTTSRTSTASTSSMGLFAHLQRTSTAGELESVLSPFEDQDGRLHVPWQAPQGLRELSPVSSLLESIESHHSARIHSDRSSFRRTA